MPDVQIPYIPLWARYLPQLREAGASYEDIGRLVMTMMETQFEGGSPEKHLEGASRSIWPFIKPDLEQARTKYAVSIENGSKGGRRKPNHNPDITQGEPSTNPDITQGEPSTNPDITQGEPSTNPKEPMSKTKTMSKTSLSSSEDKDCIRASAKQAKKPHGEFGWVKLTDDEYNRLLNDLGEAEVKRCIAYVDTSAQSTGNKNKWRDWNLVVRRCHKEGWGLDQQYQRALRMPKGASGELGAAELEAIRRSLQEGAKENA